MKAGQSPHMLMEQGAAALQRGDPQAAEAAFAGAAEIDPTMADAWFNLGWVQRARRRFEEALTSYERALAAGVSGPEEAHVNRAAILAEHLFRSEEAIAEYERALALHPGFPPALVGLAQLHEDDGRIEQARDAYRQLLARVPGDGRALARLAMLDLRDRDPDAVAGELLKEVERSRHAEDRAELLFALASALDAAGRYREAFSYVLKANRLAEQLTGARYQPAAFEQMVTRLIATFAEVQLPSPPEEDGPIFLCGLFRSGSTLTEQILARHSAVRAGGELEAISAMASELQPYPEAVKALSRDQLGDLRSIYGKEMARVGGSGGRVTDKRCDNFVHLGLIHALFAGAPTVHTTRHPLDTLVSTLFLRFGEGVSYGYRLEDAAHHAIQHDRLMRHWRQVLPNRIYDFSYDALVREPEAALRPLLSFLGLPWDERLLQPAEAGTVRTASNWQVRQPLHSRSSGRWRHYAAELEPARQMLEAAGIALPD